MNNVSNERSQVSGQAWPWAGVGNDGTFEEELQRGVHWSATGGTFKTKVGRGTTYIILVVGHGCGVVASEELLNQGEFGDGR